MFFSFVILVNVIRKFSIRCIVRNLVLENVLENLLFKISMKIVRKNGCLTLLLLI